MAPMAHNGLPKEEILRTLGAIDTLFARGRRGTVMPLRYVWRIEPAEGMYAESAPVEVLFSVPKKFFKRANKRNLLRRRIKESYRTAKHPLVERVRERGMHLTMAFIYSSKEISDYNTINDAVVRALSQICERM